MRYFWLIFTLAVLGCSSTATDLTFAQAGAASAGAPSTGGLSGASGGDTGGTVARGSAGSGSAAGASAGGSEAGGAGATSTGGSPAGGAANGGAPATGGSSAGGAGGGAPSCINLTYNVPVTVPANACLNITFGSGQPWTSLILLYATDGAMPVPVAWSNCTKSGKTSLVIDTGVGIRGIDPTCPLAIQLGGVSSNSVTLYWTL